MANPNYTPNTARSVSITTANTTNYYNPKMDSIDFKGIFSDLPISTEQKTRFTSGAILAIFRNVLAKSNTSREKLNLPEANSNTPIFDRVIFVCSIRTPSENLSPPQKNPLVKMASVFSMVGRKGQRSIVGCISFGSSFLTPLRLTASREKQNGKSFKFTKGLSTMIFKFLCLDREAPNNTYQTAVLTLEAPNEDEARWQLSSRWKLLLDRPIARFSSAINGGQA